MRFPFLSVIHLSALCVTSHAQEIFKATGGKHPEHLVPWSDGGPQSMDILSGFGDMFYLREPSFGPQVSLAVNSGDSSASVLDPFDESRKPEPKVHTATVLELSFNLRLIRDEALVRTRYTAEIDAEMAARISRVWAMFLLQTSHPRNHSNGLDGISHYFSARVEDYETVGGQTWSPPKESLPGQFVAFAEKFISMVKSDKKITPEERESLMADLAALDTKLTARETILEKLNYPD